jgi:hypothetical protein
MPCLSDRTPRYLLVALTAALTACGSDKGDTASASESQTDATGDPSGGADTGGAHGDCDQLLLCIAAISPDMSAQAEMAYGPASACWNTSPEVEQGCLDTCEAALMSQGLIYPDEPACGGTGSGTTTNDTATSSTTGPAEPTSEPTVTSDPTTNPGPATTTLAETGELTTGEFTSEPDPSDTRGGDFGNCGWDDANNWYGCGGVPGLSDPANLDPIACPDDVQVGGMCSDQDGPVTGVGCCTPLGANYYCARGSIEVEDCG